MGLMRLLFGRVDEDVMDACVTYLRISAYSYPALAVYNAGAALYRSFGKTSTTMYISIFANIINVAGNCIGVFLLHAGVAGVAYPSPDFQGIFRSGGDLSVLFPEKSGTVLKGMGLPY